MQIFKCNEGCYACCPGAENENVNFRGKRMFVNASIGDVYRSFVHNNPDNLTFSKVFHQQFHLGIYEPWLKDKPESDLSEDDLNFLQNMGAIVMEKIPPKDVFQITPKAREPCYNLDHGCKVHATLSKYLICVIQPESRILNRLASQEASPKEENLFYCIENKILEPAVAERVVKLRHLLDREKQISMRIFPRIRVPGTSNDKAHSFDDVYCPNIKREIQERIKSFDDPKNRFWQEEIEELTREYAEIMNLDL